jgi:hypothetical protein
MIMRRARLRGNGLTTTRHNNVKNELSETQLGPGCDNCPAGVRWPDPLAASGRRPAGRGMRSTWPFVAGIILAALVTVVTLPIVVATSLAMAIVGAFGHNDVEKGGASSFIARNEQGRMVTHLANTSYHRIRVAVPGDPRPRSLLLRQRLSSGDDGDGRVRVDAWPLESVADLEKPPLYTIRAAAGTASLGDDGMLWVEFRGRRSAWSLAEGLWLFDADVPLVSFTPEGALEGEQRRLVTLAAADEDMVSRGVIAVITYAAPGRVLQRVMLEATDTLRASTLRATITATRLVSRLEEASGRRTLELPLAAGPVRLPVTGDAFDLSQASVPAGLKLVPVRQWIGGSP